MAALAAVSILFVFGGQGSGGFLHFLTKRPGKLQERSITSLMFDFPNKPTCSNHASSLARLSRLHGIGEPPAAWGSKCLLQTGELLLLIST